MAILILANLISRPILSCLVQFICYWITISLMPELNFVQCFPNVCVMYINVILEDFWNNFILENTFSSENVWKPKRRSFFAYLVR